MKPTIKPEHGDNDPEATHSITSSRNQFGDNIDILCRKRGRYPLAARNRDIELPEAEPGRDAETKGETPMSKCYCLGCQYASDDINCCGKRSKTVWPKGERTWRWCAGVVKEKLEIVTKLNQKNLPYSIDGAFNGTYLSAGDRVVDWVDTEELLKKLLGDKLRVDAS